MNSQNRTYPRNWGEMSLDFKLSFIFFACVAGLMLAGRFLTISAQLVMAGLFAGVAVLLSLDRRRRLQWHWPGANTRGLFGAVGALAAAAVMVIEVHPTFPFATFLPWYLGLAEISLFNVLRSAHVVELSDADFLRFCGPASLSRAAAPSATTGAKDPFWKRATRAAFGTVSVVIWLESAAYFYFFDTYFRGGAPKPTPTQPAQLFSHGLVAYITPVQKSLVDRLDTWMSYGIPAIIVTAVFLQYVMGVELAPNAPTWQQIRQGKYKSG